MTLFDCINNILFKKSIELYKQHINDGDFDRNFSNYIVLRYCTMTNNVRLNASIAMRCLYLEKLEPKILYLTLLKIIPKQQSHYINYIK